MLKWNRVFFKILFKLSATPCMHWKFQILKQSLNFVDTKLASLPCMILHAYVLSHFRLCAIPWPWSGSSVTWDPPGKNSGVGCHFLLQGIFPILESNPGLLHCRQILYLLSHLGSPRTVLSPHKSPMLQIMSSPIYRLGKSFGRVKWFAYICSPRCSWGPMKYIRTSWWLRR